MNRLLFVLGVLVFTAPVKASDRPLEYVDGSEAYFRSIGRITSKAGGCTATIVGYRQIVTAAHCLPGGVYRAGSDIVFHPMLHRGRTTGTSGSVAVTFGWTGKGGAERSLVGDWAVLYLESHPTDSDGRRLPEARVTSAPHAYNRGETIEVVGYAGERRSADTASKCVGRFIRYNQNHGLYNHSCMTEKGMSGGPIFQRSSNTLIGITLGGMDDQDIRDNPALALLIGLATKDASLLDSLMTPSSSFWATLSSTRKTYGSVGSSISDVSQFESGSRSQTSSVRTAPSTSSYSSNRSSGSRVDMNQVSRDIEQLRRELSQITGTPYRPVQPKTQAQVEQDLRDIRRGLEELRRNRRR